MLFILLTWIRNKRRNLINKSSSFVGSASRWEFCQTLSLLHRRTPFRSNSQIFSILFHCINYADIFNSDNFIFTIFFIYFFYLIFKKIKKEKKGKKYLTIFFNGAIIIPVIKIAGIAQLVERQPSKLNVASSTLVSRSIFLLKNR